MSLVLLNQAFSQFKPKARPNRFLSRPLDRYKLSPTQVDYLNRHRYLPRTEKRPRPTNMSRANSPPDQLEVNFLGTSAGTLTLAACDEDRSIWKLNIGPRSLLQESRRCSETLLLWLCAWMVTCNFSTSTSEHTWSKRQVALLIAILSFLQLDVRLWRGHDTPDDANNSQS